MYSCELKKIRGKFSIRYFSASYHISASPEICCGVDLLCLYSLPWKTMFGITCNSRN
jgi:hypothetical protein